GGTGVSTLSIGNEKEGKIHVGKVAVEDYISEFSNDVFGVHNAKAVVKMADNLLNVRVNASIEPGINIPDTTDEIKQIVKKNVLATIGIEVKDVEVFFKHIKPKG
ncbi:MAG: Asp23/Gls24 family envelope stress response protein, partial [Acidaminococcaceae bacterium]